MNTSVCTLFDGHYSKHYQTNVCNFFDRFMSSKNQNWTFGIENWIVWAGFPWCDAVCWLKQLTESSTGTKTSRFESNASLDYLLNICVDISVNVSLTHIYIYISLLYICLGISSFWSWGSWPRGCWRIERGFRNSFVPLTIFGGAIIS